MCECHNVRGIVGEAVWLVVFVFECRRHESVISQLDDGVTGTVDLPRDTVRFAADRIRARAALIKGHLGVKGLAKGLLESLDVADCGYACLLMVGELPGDRGLLVRIGGLLSDDGAPWAVGSRGVGLSPQSSDVMSHVIMAASTYAMFRFMSFPLFE